MFTERKPCKIIPRFDKYDDYERMTRAKITMHRADTQVWWLRKHKFFIHQIQVFMFSNNSSKKCLITKPDTCRLEALQPIHQLSTLGLYAISFFSFEYTTTHLCSRIATHSHSHFSFLIKIILSSTSSFQQSSWFNRKQ